MFAALWSLYLEIAPLLVFGLAVAGLLHVLVPEEAVERHLGRRGRFGTLKATLFAIPLPLCSCSVVPVVAGLRRKGASQGASVSFLIAAPQIGADSFLLTQGLLGLPFAAYRAAASFLTALVAGLAVQRLPDSNEPLQSGGVSAGPPRRTLREFAGYAQDLLGSMANNLLIGLVLAALILVFLPDEIIGDLLQGQDWLGRLLMLAVGIPMYVCATASTPIAAALVVKGVSPGAALVFLLTGPATNILTLAMLRSSLGLRAMGVYLLSIAGFSLAAGWLLDRMPTLSAALVEAPCLHGEESLTWWGLGGALLLGGMLLLHYLKPLFRPSPSASSEELAVFGMTCAHCAGRIVKAVEATGLVADAVADPAGNRVRYRPLPGASQDERRRRLKEAIELAGFRTEP
jgi:uncharacterized protein